MGNLSGYSISLTLLVLASFASGDSNARINSNHPRLQSKLTAPHTVRTQVPQRSNRRTFVTVLLAAEVAYLEGLLSKQNKKASKKNPKTKPSKPVHNHIHSHNKVKHTHKQQHPTYAFKKATTTPKAKYVSKLDPFYMLAAPDLSAKSPSYNVPEAPPAASNKAPPAASYKAPQAASYKGPAVTEVAPSYAPPPTYGAYEEYKVPAAPPISSKSTVEPSKPDTTKLKYGDFVLYQPQGYLSPLETKPVPKYKVPTYKVPSSTVNIPVTYKPSNGYLPPIKVVPAKSKTSTYKTKASPSKTQIKAPKAANSYLPPRKEAYKKPELAPVKYRPSKGYLSHVKQTPPPYKAPSAPAYKSQSPPKYEAPANPPKYQAPAPSTNETPAYKAPAPGPSYVTQSIPVYQPTAPSASSPSPPAPKKSNPNPHPHTFFHDEQAKKVHKGDWPPIYYNSLHGDQAPVRRS